MPKVGIVMGSDSDLKVMSKAADMLEKLGIDYEMTIISAHRMPDVFFDWAKAAEGKGINRISIVLFFMIRWESEGSVHRQSMTSFCPCRKI